MSRKDFDAKQFLLEKGERVGLGVAVTLMVLMLILSLFMPGKGFFSGSPSTKAKELRKTTDDLDNDLRTREPGANDKPEERGEDKLIAFNREELKTDNYATAMWFEPRMQENKSRRPPDIYNVEEAIAEVAYVPIDTYKFLWQSDPPKICVLVDKDKGNPLAGGAGGKNNPFSGLSGRGGMGGMMPAAPGGPGGPGGNNLRGRFNGNFNAPGSLFGVGGAADKPEYETRFISVNDWNPNQLTAHQLQPLRMAIIAGSFPYKKQLEEHKNKLRLDSIDRVLDEPVGEGDKKASAFYFRGVVVERMEVDADGKPIHDWFKLPVKEAFDEWLKNSYYPAQEENPKYAQVLANDGRGLLMPRLREFDASKLTSPGLPGGMLPGMGLLGGQQRRQEPTPEQAKTKYPDVASKLPKIQDTLDNLQKAQPKSIAASKFQRAELTEVFNPNILPPSDNPATTNQPGGPNSGEPYVPEYVLVRVVDVTIEPGKHYKYRLKIKMTNPNYQRMDVASPEYKEKEILESKEWYELPQTVIAPPELQYYVVDELQGLSQRDLNALRSLSKLSESAQARMLAPKRRLSSDEVVFQFHRWVEQTRPSRREDPIPVGEWAVAERVVVTRGEYVGRTVNVDLPIWKYTQNGFILPAENQKVRPGRKANTGIDVEFAQDPPENNLILVDFEGGRVSSQTPNVNDTCAIEVLMLAPDGTLLARNSVKDTSDKERMERRLEVYKRIQDVREGKGPE